MLSDEIKLADWECKDTIAVLGSARKYTPQQVVAAFRIGREVGRLRYHLITGATSGLPYAAALGAKCAGAIVVGISPAKNLEEHQHVYDKPTRQADVMVFTGMGPDGRSPLILRSCKAAIFIGGELGTLGEFCSAWMCGDNVLGILRGGGGIVDSLEEILSQIETTWGSQVLFDEDPESLVRRVGDALGPAKDVRSEPCEDVRSIIRQHLADEGLLS